MDAVVDARVDDDRVAGGGTMGGQLDVRRRRRGRRRRRRRRHVGAGRRASGGRRRRRLGEDEGRRALLLLPDRGGVARHGRRRVERGGRAELFRVALVAQAAVDVAAAAQQDLLERRPEVAVEPRVDDRVQETVGEAEPQEQAARQTLRGFNNNNNMLHFIANINIYSHTRQHRLRIQYLDVSNSVKFVDFKIFLKFSKIQYHIVSVYIE